MNTIKIAESIMELSNEINTLLDNKEYANAHQHCNLIITRCKAMLSHNLNSDDCIERINCVIIDYLKLREDIKKIE